VLEEARKALTAALSLKPNEARAYEALSTVHERAGRPDQALAAIEAALQLAPDNALYRQRRDRMAAPSS
jgi:Flp pilus assembly protein TadD